jgi:HD-GYP domain-containing protein (c-di-GMP phosphodiesterase class II)
MRIVPLSCVREGTRLAKTIYNSKGSILLKAGVVLSEALITRIEENGLYTIYIDDGYSDEEINELIKPEVRNQAIKAIKETFQNIEKFNSSMKNEFTSFNDKLKVKGMEKYLQQLKQVSDYIVEDITNSRQLMINLVDIKSIDNYTYEHSLNVAVLSLILGIELKLSKGDLYKLFMGALLHDVGKAFLPKELLSVSFDELNEDQQEQYKNHTLDGYNYLKEHYSLSSHSKVVALQHHEHYDGSGYPRGMSGNFINRMARIVAIANSYDEITSDTVNSPAKPPNEAIEYIMGAAGRYFDFDMANTFVRKIIPYPAGTLVKLSNGQIAVVEKVNPNYPLRPVINILNISKAGVQKSRMDLLVNPNIVIDGIQYVDPKDSKNET